MTSKIVSLKEILDSEIPDVTWIVDKLIPDNGVSIIGGTSGMFKSWAAMQMALSVASGTKFLNHFDTKKSAVMFVDEENGLVTIANRFRKLKNGHNLYNYSFENLFVSIFSGVKLDRLGGCKELEKMINTHKPRLVIIDSMVRCMVGEEDRAKDVRRIFDNIKPMLTQYDKISFVILHHTTKGRKRHLDALRGSGDFAAFSDVILMFSVTKNFVDVDIVKNRHIDRNLLNGFSIRIENPIGDSVRLSYLDVNPDESDAIEDCQNDIEEWLKSGNIVDFTSKQVLSNMYELGHAKNTIYRALKVLKDDKIVSKQSRGKWRCHTTGVTDDKDDASQE